MGRKRDTRAQREPRAHTKAASPDAASTPLVNPRICVYCQQRAANSEEHVVARCFFSAKLPPRRYIKVPACTECNSGSGDGYPSPLSKDEEYVRTVFAHEHRCSDHPVARELIANEMARMFDNSPRFLRRIAHNMKLTDARLKSGIIVPNVPTMSVETDRVIRVLRKIVRGLFYSVYERPKPLDWPLRISARLNREHFHTCEHLMSKWPNTGWWRIGDEGAFRFRSACENRNSNNTGWLMVFYDNMAFWADTFNVKADG